jgi:putative phage-type endonuclease
MNNELIQGSADWLEMRKQHVGASDAPVIMGVSPYKTQHQLWEEKLGLTNNDYSNKGTKYGQEMEEPARRAYEKLTGIIVAPTVVFHPDRPYMMASLDGLSFDKKTAVEIKNVCEEDHEKAKSGVVPEKYFPQVQHQLAVLDLPSLHYFSFRKGDFALVDVLKDDNYLQTLYSAEKEFWDSVLNFKEPNLSERDYQKFISQEWETMAKEWKETNEQLKALTAKEKEYRQALITLACDGNATGAGIKLTKSIRKGTVDYSRIPELEGVDLDQYRKDPVVAWRLT